MDFLNALYKLKEHSGELAIKKGEDMYSSPDHGKPQDYGFSGRARNVPVTRRMAGGSLMNALVGELVGAGFDATKPHIDSGMQQLVSNLRGTNNVAMQ